MRIAIVIRNTISVTVLWLLLLVLLHGITSAKVGVGE
jgi:hypothetical protein